jgi:hypothetical protein
VDPVTLADMRKLIGHLPKEARAKSTRRHVEAVPPGSRYATDSVPPGSIDAVSILHAICMHVI